MSKRILVTGSRHWSNETAVRNALTNTLRVLDVPAARAVLVHGDAPGLDTIAAKVAWSLGMAVEAHPAKWSEHGRAAGPIRNAEMVAAGADVCLAFPLGGPSGSRGTYNCLRAAREAGIPTLIIDGEDTPRQGDGPCNVEAPHGPHRWDNVDSVNLRWQCPGVDGP